MKLKMIFKFLKNEAQLIYNIILFLDLQYNDSKFLYIAE